MESEVPGAASSLASTYDDLPYGWRSHERTHPIRIATAARLRGFRAAPFDRCRVLEIGCANGGNLIPLAESAPGSEFVGIDLSERQVAFAGDRIRELGLTNVVVEQLDLCELDDRFGTFDYVIAHGVLSWIPRALQSDLFRVSKMLLSDRGLAYVSYNTYPGWHMRGVLRSILVDAVPHDAPTGERVRIARAVARQVATDAEHFEGFGERLAGHARELLDYEDHYLAHDHLELENHPLWFREFLDLAARHGLQFVDDLEVSPNVAPSDLHGLQYVDRISGVTFRASVLCAADVELEDGRSPAGLAQLFVAGPLRPEGTVEMDEGVTTTIQGLSGKAMQTSSRTVKLLARSISAAWPQSRPVEALIADVVDEVGSGGSDDSAVRRQLLDAVLNLHRRRVVELETQPYPFTRQISARPIVSAGNRWAAEAGELLTGGRHERHRFDRFAAFVACRLDGSRTLPDLVDDVVRAGEDGTLSFSDADDSQLRGTELRAAADETVPEVLRHLASIGLLVG